jgi:hypothetical protein
MIDRVRSLVARVTEADERGAALIWVAGSLVALLAFTALAVDMGWYYLNGTRLQRAADAGALAGVIHIPAEPGTALTMAMNAVNANGFDPILVTDRVVTDNSYEVTVDAEVPTFFAGVIGFDTLPLRRTATAEYVKPVPMGSPFSTFGYGYDDDQGFWAAIQAPYTAKEHGDPHATKCVKTSQKGKCTGGSNSAADYRPEGYWYAVEVPTGANNVKVDIFDAGFYDRNNFAGTGDEENLTDTAPGGADMHFQLYAPDSTPLNPKDNAAIAGCSLDLDSGEKEAVYKEKWKRLCTLGNPDPGLYALRVWTTGTGGGSSHYALSVDVGGVSGERIYAIDDMSVFTNDVAGSGTAYVYLAEVDPMHAGHKLEVRFYDPGEGSGNAYMTVYDGDNKIPSCSWSSTDEDGDSTGSGSGACKIKTTTNGNANFNGEWIAASIDIPSDYTCDMDDELDCWWYMKLDLNNAHDRTTWEAHIGGNPVRLVANE